MKKKEKIKLEGNKLRLVENRSYTVRTGSLRVEYLQTSEISIG